VIQSAAYERALLRFLEPIAPVLAQPDVSEVVINGPSKIFIERRGKLEAFDAELDPEGLLGALRVVAQYAGRPLDDEFPILEAHLPDGARLEAVLAPIAEGGPCVAIRKHQLTSLSAEKLVELGALSEEALAYLQQAVAHQENILVSGGTGSGKTSLLRVLATMSDPDERLLVLEDARELALQRNHVVSLETRPADARGRGRITMADLLKATLRLRPDRIVMGEVRGAEALDLIQAMSTGHGGCLSTIHASSPVGALRRLETMALLAGYDVPLTALRAQVALAIHVVVQIERLAGGKRGVTEIARVLPLSAHGEYEVETVFLRTPEGLLREGRA
jgi:pilus assembly protein CpaF